LLKTKLDFDEQISFQHRGFSPDDKRFKPTPAGYHYYRNNVSVVPDQNSNENETNESAGS
jgi:hypothetical protein